LIAGNYLCTAGGEGERPEQCEGLVSLLRNHLTCIDLPVQVVKVKGLSSVKGWSHYFTIISRVVVSYGDEDNHVDSVILGIDIKHDTNTHSK